MAQQDWGAAEPIRQVAQRAADTVRRIAGVGGAARSTVTRKPPARDTSWHDDKVREANRSFQERDAKDRAEAARRKTANSRPMARKSTSRASAQRSSKRSSGR